MQPILDTLEWLTRYGIIDIVFGVGVIGFVARLVGKAIPSNYDLLHVSVSIGPVASLPQNAPAPNTMMISLGNAGQTNVYIARAYFRPKLRRWWFLWLKRTQTSVRMHPLAFKITHKDAYEIKFQGNSQGFSNYEALVPPGHSGGQTTFLPLRDPLNQSDIDNRRCGVLYFEYATTGKQGVHAVRV